MMIASTDPRTGESVASGVTETSAADLDACLRAAADAAPSYAASPPAVRARVLRGLADALDAAVDDLVPLAISETGLPAARLMGEVARTSGQLRLFAAVVEEGSYLEAVLDSADPDATPPRADLRRVLVPLGPVLVFAASNFPFAFSVLGGDTASALACGSPVIVKAHPGHPALSQAVATLSADVVAGLGLPGGLLGVIHGTDAGVRALKDPRIQAAGFTGSTHAGRLLFDIAAQRPAPIPFYGELGSINPVVVTPDALTERGDELLRGFVGSFTFSAGQLCTKPGLLFVPHGHGVAEQLVELVGPVAPAPLLNDRIASQLGEGLGRLATHPRVELLVQAGAAPTAGAWASATIHRTSATALAEDPEALAQEHFGPAALLVEYEGPEDLLRAVCAVEGSLTATVHAQPEDGFPVDQVLAAMTTRAGRIVFNDWPTGVAVSWSMHHGGPWPATTSAGHTSVGATAIRRWLRPVCYQAVPDELLPEPLRDGNPWRVPRRVDGVVDGQPAGQPGR